MTDQEWDTLIDERQMGGNDVEVCQWCDETIAEDEGHEWCSRRGEYMHSFCHYESECRCPG